jgi:glutaminyl-tRNA synthetase
MPDFIRDLVAADLASGKHRTVVTRFPPEPNGYLHIGHAKSICLNFGIAREHPGGKCHLRFDDTNPTTEDVRYVEAIKDDVRWLGFEWDHLCHASDYFERLYDYAERLIEQGRAYVDSSSEEEIREERGTVTTPGRESRYRNRSVGENLDLFRRMRAAEFPNGAHVLRAKIDMASPNMLMRDPLLYRIRHAHHYRRGDAWCIYPLYDFAHCLSDSIEGITHSLCTLEFKDNRALYDWILDQLDVPQPQPRQTEFARLNLDYTVLSKRRLVELVKRGLVTGWDDPRMPTLAGLRRRGVTAEAIRAFCDLIGVAKVDSRIDIEKLEYVIRDDLNLRVRRVMCVLRPLRVVIENYPEGQVEQLDASYYPHDVPLAGSRTVPFSRVLYIERDDFREDPPKHFHRLGPGREVRLRYAYFITCERVVKDPETGEVVELRCTYDPATRGGDAPDGRKVKGTLHWISADHSIPVEVRLYDRLFTNPDPEDVREGEDFTASINPESLVVPKDSRIEPSVQADVFLPRYQFERLGYFFADPVDCVPGRLVFNRTVTLRDAWAKREAPAADSEGRRGRKRGPAATSAARGPAAVPAAVARYIDGFGVPYELAKVLARDEALSRLFEDAVAEHGDARSVAAWVVTELPRETRGSDVASLPFGGAELGRLVALVDENVVSRNVARLVLGEMVAGGGDPRSIVERRGLEQVGDADTLGPIVDRIIATHPGKADEYRGGRTGLLGFFVGQVMKETGGRADPEVVKELVGEKLGVRST